MQLYSQNVSQSTPYESHAQGLVEIRWFKGEKKLKSLNQNHSQLKTLNKIIRDLSRYPRHWFGTKVNKLPMGLTFGRAHAVSIRERGRTDCVNTSLTQWKVTALCFKRFYWEHEDGLLLSIIYLEGVLAQGCGKMSDSLKWKRQLS